MFRDREEELKRLQEQLLQIEEEAPAQNEDTPEVSMEATQALDEEMLNTLLHENDQSSSPQVYQNYSNQYGSDYRIYNADQTDEDPEAYSQVLLEPEKSNGNRVLWLALLVIALMAAILGVLGWLYMGGMLI